MCCSCLPDVTVDLRSEGGFDVEMSLGRCGRVSHGVFVIAVINVSSNDLQVR